MLNVNRLRPQPRTNMALSTTFTGPVAPCSDAMAQFNELMDFLAWLHDEKDVEVWKLMDEFCNQPEGVIQEP